MTTFLEHLDRPRHAGRDLAALAFALLLGSQAAGAPVWTVAAVSVSVRPLFVDVGTPVAPASGILRSRHVRVDYAVLDETPHPGDALTFNLFEDALVTGIFDREVRRSPESFTWFGDLLGELPGRFNLTREGDAVIANVVIYGRDSFRVCNVTDGLHAVHQLNLNGRMSCGLGRDGFMAPPPGPPSKSGSATSADDGSSIDVLIVYSNQVGNPLGNANSFVDVANDALGNSDVETRFRLVATRLTDYDENATFTSMQTHFTNLVASNDTDMNEVPDLRDYHGADLVSLMVTDSDFGTTWGHAEQMYSLGDATVYTVVSVDATSPDRALAHELGHNVGCDHDVEDPTAGLYSFSRAKSGWCVWPISKWYTVMTSSLIGSTNNYSNPDVYACGDPTGTENEHDNARTIDASDLTVARFRPSITNVDFAYNDDGSQIEDGSYDRPWSSLFNASINSSPGHVVRLQPGANVENVTILLPMTLEAEEGPVTIIGHP